MDKETVVLVIAQNGLGTAAKIIEAKAKKLQAQLLKATGDEIVKIEEKLKRSEKLAQVLRSADAGVTEYMAG